MRGRRGYRGQASGRTFSTSRSSPQFQIGASFGGRDIYEHVNERLQTIALPESGLGGGDDDNAVTSSSANNTQVIASYSWIDARCPTILVPGESQGAPPVWRDRSFPFSVERDQSTQYIDQNLRQQNKIHPMMPLLASVRHISPNFDYSTIDLITARNSLRKLMKCVGTASDTRPCEDFRINIDVVGRKKKTILFTRWETRDYDEQLFGYGQNFVEATTSTPHHCENATSHNRIVQYDFAGLTLLVRYEADATLPVIKRIVTAPRPGRLREDTLDGLSSQVALLSIRESNAAASSGSGDSEGDLQVIPTSHEISPQSSIIEIKSRSARSYESFDWSGIFPQLFFSQIPHLYIGIHRQGTFEQLVKYRIPTSLRLDADSEATGDAIQASPAVQRALDRARQAIKNLGLLLKRLREVVLEQVRTRDESSGMVLLCESGKLSLYSRSPEDKLPLRVVEGFN